MNNVLLISHDGLASGAKKATELILGEERGDIAIIELTGDVGIDNFKQELNEKIRELIKDNSTLVIIADLKNGTPYNCALSIIASNNLWGNIFLFSGLNLNLVLETVMASESQINKSIANEIILSAQQGIAEMNKIIWDKQCNSSEE